MSEHHSTPEPTRSKPAKPYPDFPLTYHPAGYWCKKVRRQLHYFGPRLHRAKQGPKLFTAEEIQKLLDAASVQMRAMILLGINCGFGNADCGNLPLSALDLEGGWVDYPRPKTGINRRCALWGETVAAIREALAKRREPKDKEDAGLVFITKYGQSWAKTDNAGPLTQRMRKLLDTLDINGHRNFYFPVPRNLSRRSWPDWSRGPRRRPGWNWLARSPWSRSNSWMARRPCC